jgi:hypothetical protein
MPPNGVVEARPYLVLQVRTPSSTPVFGTISGHLEAQTGEYRGEDGAYVRFRPELVLSQSGDWHLQSSAMSRTAQSSLVRLRGGEHEEHWWLGFQHWRLGLSSPRSDKDLCTESRGWERVVLHPVPAP